MSGRNRNKPCTCGSGKKQKHCCYDGAKLQREAAERSRVNTAVWYKRWEAAGRPFISGSGVPDYAKVSATA